MDNGGKNFNLDDFNLNTNETTWEAPQRDTQALGNKIIATNTSASAPELGQVVDLAMPPNYSLAPEGQPTSESTSEHASGAVSGYASEQAPADTPAGTPAGAPGNISAPAQSGASSLATQPAQAYGNIKTANRLNSAGVSAVSQVIQKLGQDGNVADFYEEARSLMERNLDSSYDRKIGGDPK